MNPDSTMSLGRRGAVAAPRPATAREVEQLLVMRELAVRNYRDFLKLWLHCNKTPFLWNWHMDYLADVMQAVADCDPEVRFTIVNIPPRFAKSTLLSQLWQAWMIVRDQSWRSSLFSCTATAMLASRDSRRTLNALQSEWYKSAFPWVQLDAKVTEAEWEVKGGAYRIATGRDGTTTGRGAVHLLWDDILLAREGNSELVRSETNEWLGETLRNRMDDLKTGTITGIMQRLHEIDATGYLLEQMKIPGADQYKHIVLPLEAPKKTQVEFKGVVYAEREQGDLLHPDRIGPEEVRALKISMRANFDGQYQQNPVKMDGGHLDPRRLVELDGTAAEIAQRLGLRPSFYLDFASKEKQITDKDDPDDSCIFVVARDQMRRLVLLDCYAAQVDHGTLARTCIRMHQAWRPSAVKGEKGALLNVFRPVIIEEMKKLGHFFNLEALPAPQTLGDKVERSIAFQGMLNAGVVCVPKGATWLAKFTSQMRVFPLGAHDDTLDPPFYAALDFQNLRSGESPGLPGQYDNVTTSDSIKAAIAEAMARVNAPKPVSPDHW